MSYSTHIYRVEDDGEPYYVAKHPELLGCASHGDTPEEAEHNLAETLEEYLEDLRADGIEPPKPRVFTVSQGTAAINLTSNANFTDPNTKNRPRRGTSQ